MSERETFVAASGAYVILERGEGDLLIVTLCDADDMYVPEGTNKVVMRLRVRGDESDAARVWLLKQSVPSPLHQREIGYAVEGENAVIIDKSDR